MVLVIFIKMHVNFNTFGAAYDISLLTAYALNHALYGRIQRGGGGQGVRTPLPPGKLQRYSHFRYTGPDPLESHRTTKAAFHNRPSLARQRNVI